MGGQNISVDTEAAIRQQIVQGEIPPGSWLRETALAERLDVSRTPVREACTRLARDGLLEWIPNRGFMLRPLDPAELDSSYPVLVALEALAIDLLPDNVDDLVAELRNPALRLSPNSGDAVALYGADRLWHHTIVAATGNPVLTEFHDRLSERMARHIFAYWDRHKDVAESDDEHAQVVDALDRGDTELASAFLATHRRRGLRRIRELLG